jgi:acetyl-CoA C-acetyltransferase
MGSPTRATQEQIDLAAYLLRKNALVAASNPNAWFQDAPTATEIATVTEDNRMIVYPYTKRMNAIMDVDQAAALVVVSNRYLETSGDRSRAAAILGGAGAEEVWNPIQRSSLSKCAAMQIAFNDALASAGLTPEEVDAFDFYSCFPSPIQLALDALDIPTEDPRPFSITGGLAYAGGPGNNYVMHSLATALAHLRDEPGHKLMITGVGMANTKHAATLLANSQHTPGGATGVTRYRVETGEQPMPVAEQAQGRCSVVSYTVEYDREGVATNIIYILDTASGERAIANALSPDQDAAQVLREDPVGKTGELTWDAGTERQYFQLV